LDLDERFRQFAEVPFFQKIAFRPIAHDPLDHFRFLVEEGQDPFVGESSFEALKRSIIGLVVHVDVHQDHIDGALVKDLKSLLLVPGVPRDPDPFIVLQKDFQSGIGHGVFVDDEQAERFHSDRFKVRSKDPPRSLRKKGGKPPVRS
jgi:hypothetical protein